MSEVEPFQFTGAGGQTLAGQLHLPAVEPQAWAVFAHCFTCSKESRAARYVSRALADRGIATLRFDFTGLGESEGDFEDVTFARDVDDVVAAADALRERFRAPALLVGHSRGGTATLAAASRIEECTAVATIGAPFRSSSVAGALDTDGIGRLERALLLFHSPQDEVVDIDEAREIFVAARHPKSFVSLDGANHLLGRRRDASYVAEVLASWASRYLPDETEADQEEEEGPPGKVVVEGKTTGLLQRIRTRDLTFASDEPVDKGGTNAAPNPYDLLLASLGACTSMTLKMYAGRKGWPLEAVRVTLSHDRVHAKDCEDCEKESGMIDLIEKKLELTGELSEEQRRRLLEISARCPVHRTLVNEIKIRSELV